MTDNKELIERARKGIVSNGDHAGEITLIDAEATERLIADLANALEAAQVQMQEAYTAGVEGAPLIAKEIYAEATASAYGAAVSVKYDPKYGKDWLGMSAAVLDLTPASARDWLAAHDKEIVERCAKIAEDKVHGWNAAAAIRAGGEQ